MKELTKKNYEAPKVRIVRAIVEKGFAVSFKGEDTNKDWGTSEPLNQPPTRAFRNSRGF